MTEIKIGQVYMAKFSKSEHPVRLERIHPQGGWTAKAFTHGKSVRIKDASQLLYRCTDEEVQDILRGVMPNRRSKIQGPVYREQAAPLGDEEKRAMKKVIRPKPKEVMIVTRLSLLDAAHRVLSETKKAMTTREIVVACEKKQYWASSAATPWATLNAALNRDLAANGAESRFVKIGRGLYSLR